MSAKISCPTVVSVLAPCALIKVVLKIPLVSNCVDAPQALKWPGRYPSTLNTVVAVWLCSGCLCGSRVASAYLLQQLWPDLDCFFVWTAYTSLTCFTEYISLVVFVALCTPGHDCSILAMVYSGSLLSLGGSVSSCSRRAVDVCVLPALRICDNAKCPLSPHWLYDLLLGIFCCRACMYTSHKPCCFHISCLWC